MKIDKPDDTRLSQRSGYETVRRSNNRGARGGSLAATAEGATGAKEEEDEAEGIDLLFGGGEGWGGWGGGGGWGSSAKNDSVTVDFRDEEAFELPSGLELVNAKLAFDQGEDGSMALVIPEGAFLKLTMPKPSYWGGGFGLSGLGGGGMGRGAAFDDGQVRTWSMLLGVRLEALPSAGTLPLLNGGMPAAPGEKVEHVQIYKNGGIGALGNMGTQEAAVRPERWVWLALTRDNNKLTTYVNGNLGSVVELKKLEEGEMTDLHPHPIVPCADEQTRKRKCCSVTGEKGVAYESVANARSPASEHFYLSQKCYDEKVKAKRAAEAAEAEGAPKRPREKFMIDRAGCALFPEVLDLAAEIEAEARLEAGGEPEAEAERRLMVKYVHVAAGECWDREAVLKKLHELRAQDEEAELAEEVDAARQKQLALQPLYERPPPAWLHPAFAAEFGDAFIAGTAFESGSMHVSLEVQVLALRHLLRRGGLGAALPLPLASALHSASGALEEALTLAHKLAKARASGQARLWLQPTLRLLSELPPGELLVVPLAAAAPLALIVQRGATPLEERCVVTIGACTDGSLKYHEGSAQPPKMRYRTCLELRDVQFDRVCDEAVWGGLWYAMHACGSRGPLAVLYTVVVPLLTGMSLEDAMVASRRAAAKLGAGALPMRSARRTRPDYGVGRLALHYLLTRVHGVDAAAAKHASLLLRLQMLLFAEHDLPFVGAPPRAGVATPPRLRQAPPPRASRQASSLFWAS